jgi:hypothetical protein
MTKNVHDMPPLGTKYAPEKFKGRYNKVVSFLDHYERLLGQNNVTIEAEKCKTILMYCSRKVRDLIEGLDAFTSPDWTALKESLLDCYDADRDSLRWKEKDLIAFVRRHRKKSIKSMSDWKTYHRKFMRIGNWLLAHKKIDNSRHQGYFWAGIPRDLRIMLENRILSQDATLSTEKPFKIETIQKVAKEHFQRDRFENLALDSDSDTDGEDDDERESDSSDSDSDDSDSDDSDEEDRKKKKKSKSHTKNHQKLDKVRKELQKAKQLNKMLKKSPHMIPGHSSKSEIEQVNNEEIENLIDKMTQMSINDVSYGKTYYRAIVLEPRLESWLPHPVLLPQGSQQRTPMNNSHPPPPPQNQAPRRNNWNAGPAPGQMNNSAPPPLDHCFGCNGKGHGLRSCQRIQELLNAQIIQRDPRSQQIHMNGGGFIQRLQGESLAEAAIRLNGAVTGTVQNHLFYIRPSAAFEDPGQENEYDPISDEEEEEQEVEDELLQGARIEECDSDEDMDMDIDEEEVEEEEEEEEVDEDDAMDYQDEGYYHEEEEVDYDGTNAFLVMPSGNQDVEMEEVLAVGPERTTRSTRSARQKATDGPKSVSRERRKTEGTIKGAPGKPPGIPTSALPQSSTSTSVPLAPVQPPLVVAPPVQVPQTTIPSAASGSNAIPINKNIPRFQPPTFHQQTQTRMNMEQTHQTPSSPPILTPATRNIQPPAVFTPQSESQQEKQILAKKKVRSEGSIPQEIPFSTREKRQSRVPELLDEDVIMADPRPVPKPRKAVIRTPKETAPPPITVAKKPGRQSEISSKVDEKKIVSKLLDVPVTLRVAELLAVAPRIANNITEILRPRNMNSKVPVYHIDGLDRIRSSLIHLRLDIQGRPVTAIIDTGSQLNVAHKKLWGTVINLPMDPNQVLRMSDANGGERELRGLIPRVPLTCGGASTQANLFVGDHVPFDLLLGRPWQRGNRVDIIERERGTFLVFKDRRNPKIRMEVPVSQDIPAGYDEWRVKNTNWTRPAITTKPVPMHYPPDPVPRCRPIVSKTKRIFDVPNPIFSYHLRCHTPLGSGLQEVHCLPGDWHCRPDSDDDIVTGPVSDLIDREAADLPPASENGNQERKESQSRLGASIRVSLDILQVVLTVISIIYLATIALAKKFLGILITSKSSAEIRNPYISNRYREPNGRLEFAHKYQFSREATMAAAVTQPHQPSFINIVFRRLSNRGLNLPAQPIPEHATAVDRINLAADVLEHPSTKRNGEIVPFLVSGMHHINQQEAGLSDLTISGTCLSATLYREHPVTRERSVITGDMVYTFYPTGDGTPRQQRLAVPTPILTTMFEALTTPKAPRNLIAEDPRAEYPPDCELPPVFRMNEDLNSFDFPVHKYPPTDYTSLPAAFRVRSNPLERELTFISPDDVTTDAYEMFYDGRRFRVYRPNEPSLRMSVVPPLEPPGVNPYRFFPGDALEARSKELSPGDRMVRIWVDTPDDGQPLTQINSEGSPRNPHVPTSTSRYLTIANKENIRAATQTPSKRVPLASLKTGLLQGEIVQQRGPLDNPTPLQQFVFNVEKQYTTLYDDQGRRYCPEDDPEMVRKTRDYLQELDSSSTSSSDSMPDLVSITPSPPLLSPSPELQTVPQIGNPHIPVVPHSSPTSPPVSQQQTLGYKFAPREETSFAFSSPTASTDSLGLDLSEYYDVPVELGERNQMLADLEYAMSILRSSTPKDDCDDPPVEVNTSTEAVDGSAEPDGDFPGAPPIPSRHHEPLGGETACVLYNFRLPPSDVRSSDDLAAMPFDEKQDPCRFKHFQIRHTQYHLQHEVLRSPHTVPIETYGVDLLEFVHARFGGQSALQEAAKLRIAIVYMIYAIADDLYDQDWKPLVGHIGLDDTQKLDGVSFSPSSLLFRSWSCPSADGHLFQVFIRDYHVRMSSEYRQGLRVPENAFLWAEEEVFLRAAEELYDYHHCSFAAKHVRYLLDIRVRRPSTIRNWLAHGLLDLDELLQQDAHYIPSSIVQIDA